MTDLLLLHHPAGTRVLIDPACGGTVRGISVQVDGTTRSLLVDPERREPEPEGPERGGAEPGGPVADLRLPCDTRFFAGRFLVPFADRIIGGEYRWQDRPYRLTPNDGETGDAIHGFLYRTPMELRRRTPGSAALSCRLPAQPGYPWEMEVRLDFEALPDGAGIQVAVTNRSDSAAPLTVGWHPYFSPPGVALDESILQVPASEYLEVDERLRLSGRKPDVEGTAFDFRTARTVGGTQLDVGLVLGSATPPDHLRGVTLSGPAGSLGLRMGGIFEMVQLFIPPDRGSIAVEPVSAPGQALVVPGLGLKVIEPGEAVRGTIEVGFAPPAVPAPQPRRHLR